MAAEAKSTGYPVKVAEQNPFDGLYTPKHSTKISAYNANIMEVEISGEKYLAYCLNQTVSGSDNVSGGAVGSSGYNVEIYDLMTRPCKACRISSLTRAFCSPCRASSQPAAIPAAGMRRR